MPCRRSAVVRSCLVMSSQEPIDLDSPVGPVLPTSAAGRAGWPTGVAPGSEPNAVAEASSEWCLFPGADDYPDVPGVRLGADKYLGAGLWRAIRSAAGHTVFIHVAEVPDIHDHEATEEIVRAYLQRTKAPREELLVSGGTYYLHSDEVAIYPAEKWGGAAKWPGILMCASRAGAPASLAPRGQRQA